MCTQIIKVKIIQKCIQKSTNCKNAHKHYNWNDFNWGLFFAIFTQRLMKLSIEWKNCSRENRTLQKLLWGIKLNVSSSHLYPVIWLFCLFHLFTSYLTVAFLWLPGKLASGPNVLNVPTVLRFILKWNAPIVANAIKFRFIHLCISICITVKNQSVRNFFLSLQKA